MAVVYRAWDGLLQTERAVKVLRQELRDDADARARLLQEARTLARIRHPSVLDVHDVGDEGGRLYLVMELLEGNLADDVDRRGPLAPAAALAALDDVLGALEACHASGVIHRDVKPSNLLRHADGSVRLGDFGTARVELAGGPRTQLGATIGTYAYMAPEQVEDATAIDGRADLYAAGATLLTLLTGAVPHGLVNASRRPLLLEQVPEPVRALVDRATRPDAGERFPDAASMRAEVRRLRWADAPAGSAAPSPGPTPRAPWLRRGWGWVLLLGVNALAWLLGWPGGDEAGMPSPAAEPAPWAPVSTEALGASPADPPSLVPTSAHPPPSQPVDPPPAAVESPALRPAAAVRASPREPAGSTPAATPAPTEAAPPVESTEPVQQAPAPLPAEVVVTSKPWSELSIDGRPRGRTPFRGALDGGPHSVVLQAADGTRHSATLDVAGPGPSRYCWDFTTSSECPP